MNTMVGTVYKVFPMEVKDKGFKVASLIVIDENDEKNALKIQAVGIRAQELNGIRKGDKVVISFIPSGRIYTNRDGNEDCFVSLNMVDVKTISTVNTSMSLEHTDKLFPDDDIRPVINTEEYDDDLPF